MQHLAGIALGFVPALAWLLWVRWHDRHAPEPRALVVRAFVAGALATGLVIWLRPLIESHLPIGTDWRGAAVDAFVLTAPLEETTKLLALLAAVYWHRAWDEPIDGFVYGSAVGLGFASVENARYLADIGEASVVFMRGVTATLVHLATTGGVGVLLWRTRSGSVVSRIAWALLALGIAVALHGAYDLFLFRGRGELGWISLILVLPALLVLLAWKVTRARTQSTTGGPTRTTSSTRPSGPSSISCGRPSRRPSEVCRVMR